MTFDSDTEAALIRRTRDVIPLSQLQSLYQEDPDLGGLFLPSVPAEYRSSHRRLMLVGKETRRWNRGRSAVLGAHDIEAYLKSAQIAHRKCWERPESVGRSPFLSFLRHCKETMSSAEGVPAVIWANLFCMSHKNRSPRSSPAFDQIATLSQAMLSVQIELLQPTHLLFVTGPGYDRYIKRFFTVADSKVITPRRLWQFTANGIPAFRTLHPQHRKAPRPDRQRSLC